MDIICHCFGLLGLSLQVLTHTQYTNHKEWSECSYLVIIQHDSWGLTPQSHYTPFLSVSLCIITTVQSTHIITLYNHCQAIYSKHFTDTWLDKKSINFPKITTPKILYLDLFLQNLEKKSISCYGTSCIYISTSWPRSHHGTNKKQDNFF